MNEDIYDEWNSLKKKISVVSKDVQFKEGEVWWCSVGYNVGTESFGKGIDFARPVLIIKKLSHNACICIPLTTKVKNGTWFVKISTFKIERYAMLHQIRMLHSKRFQRMIFSVDAACFLEVKEKLKILLELS